MLFEIDDVLRVVRCVSRQGKQFFKGTVKLGYIEQFGIG